MPLSHAELGQRMVDGGAGVWSAAKWATYWAAPKEEQEAMAQIAEDSPDAPGVSGWTQALAIAATIATIAGDVAGFASGVMAIQALVKLL